MIVTEDVERYLADLAPERDAVLSRMEEEAARAGVPIVGPVVGGFLHLLARLTGAKRVFELGSAIGYSTIWLARAVGPGGRVYYTDGSAANARKAERNIEEAGVADRVEILVGDALTRLAETPGEFDLIFNDVDKDGYPAVFRAALGRLRPGGVLASDNVLWSGRVTGRSDDPWTQAIQEYNRLCFTTSGLWTTIVPLRDGVSVTLKLN